MGTDQIKSLLGVAVATVALYGCGTGCPKACPATREEVSQCIERYVGKTEHDALLACFPFSASQRISGTWKFGFETNEFYEGARAPLASTRNRHSNTGLVMNIELGLDTRPRVYQIEIMGRRSKCDMGLPRNLIVVDKLVSRRLVAGP